MNIQLRPIIKNDNAKIAFIIREALEDFNCALPGTVYFDPTTDHLFELFSVDQSGYFIAINNGVIVGGGGFFPTDGLPSGTCELVKMYIHRNYRGMGIGKLLLEKSMEAAKSAGFSEMYLETLPQLEKAVGLYLKNGFEKLSGPLGNSGHFGCNMWMMKKL